MVRLVGFLLLASLVAGCHHQPGSSSLFSGLSGTRVPPPGTGSYGSPTSYYQGPAKTQPSTGWRSTTSITRPTASLDGGGRVGTGVSTGLSRSGGIDSDVDESGLVGQVAAAGYDDQVGPSQAESPTLRVVKPARMRAGSLNLRGMPVSDATIATEPSTFDPPSGAQYMPPLAPATTGITGSRVVGSSIVTDNSRSARGQTKGSTAPRSAAVGGASNWRSRGATIRR